MFYLCSIGSNLNPAHHISLAVGELLARFGHLRLSSVIQTKPVGMRSRHDFLNCLFVIESALSSAQLKAEFVTLELNHGRDRSHPRSKMMDRPLDIDILASAQRDDFANTGVDSYLGELLAECYRGGQVHEHKVALCLHASKQFAEQRFGHSPVDLWQPSDDRQGPTAVHPDAGSRHIVVRHQ